MPECVLHSGISGLASYGDHKARVSNVMKSVLFQIGSGMLAG